MRTAAAAAVASVVSDSVQPHRWQPTRLPHPWDSPGKNTGVGCHFWAHRYSEHMRESRCGWCMDTLRHVDALMGVDYIDGYGLH